MKNLLYSSLLTFFIVLASSCNKDDNSLTEQKNTVTTNVQQGNWRITYFNDSGNDETSYFNGYVFQFNTNTTVVATKTGSTVNGTWNIGNDDSTVKFILDFGSTVKFEDLNDDWHVIEQSATLIKLEDVSGGNGGTDYLTFEKN
jgi:hypothetical protein